jgi:[acyl-carrier-protein] S-malonyltransferase
MGKGLLDPGSPGHQLAREASDLIGLDVSRLACDAGDDEITPTEVAQPLLLVCSIALLRVRGVLQGGEVQALAGHSLGEYSAMAASGSLPWQDALLLVRERGLAMAEAAAASGGMQGMSAVLGLQEDAVAAVLGDSVGADEVAVIANINAPGQVVISGQRVVLERIAEDLKRAGARRIIPLTVGGAFHSPLMESAAARLAVAINSAPLQTGKPQAFNIDGALRTEPEDVRVALKAQLTSAVRWTECIASLRGLGVDHFIEVGPGNTLTAMGKRIDGDVAWESLSASA